MKLFKTYCTNSTLITNPFRMSFRSNTAPAFRPKDCLEWSYRYTRLLALLQFNESRVKLKLQRACTCITNFKALPSGKSALTWLGSGRVCDTQVLSHILVGKSKHFQVGCRLHLTSLSHPFPTCYCRFKRNVHLFCSLQLYTIVSPSRARSITRTLHSLKRQM